MVGASGRIKVLHEPSAAEPFLVLDKPMGLPTAPVRAGDDCALTQAVARFPSLACVVGRKPIEFGLLHRLDTATRGCVLIAATQDAYDALRAAQTAGHFTKAYTASVVHVPDAPVLLGGFPSCSVTVAQGATITVESRFRAYGMHGAAVRPVTAESGMAARRKAAPALYRTHVTLSHGVDGAYSASCVISAGYRHQVRCHLAWLGFPICGDPLYNPRHGSAFCFVATALRFPNPVSGVIMDFALPTDSGES